MYFDYNASAPLLDIARDAVIEAMGYTGNASSVHGCGRAARRLLEDARAAVASSVAAAPQDVVFTSGATEANALACAGRAPHRIAATAIEHDSVLAAAAPGRRIPVLADGTVDLTRLKVLLEEEPRPELVAVMLANNETGVIQPVTEAASLAHAAGVLVHCDAVQGWRRMPFSMDGLGVDSLALSAHKGRRAQGGWGRWSSATGYSARHCCVVVDRSAAGAPGPKTLRRQPGLVPWPLPVRRRGRHCRQCATNLSTRSAKPCQRLASLRGTATGFQIPPCLRCPAAMPKPL